MADAGAAVVGDPVDFAGGGVGQDLGEGFEDCICGLALVGGVLKGRAQAIAGEFRNKEREVRFPRWKDL